MAKSYKLAVDDTAQTVLSNAAEFEELLSRNTVAVFDFDGVITSNLEESVYRLPTSFLERDALEEISRDIGVCADLYDTKYLRHIVYQEALQRINRLPTAGPLLDFAKQLSAKGLPFFILTARSYPAAIKRALDFCSLERLRPQEIFFVGRVAKGRQLKLALESEGIDRVLFFDDSPRHHSNSTRLIADNFFSFHVDWNRYDMAAAKRDYILALRKAFKRDIEGVLEDGGASDRSRKRVRDQ